MDKIIIKELEAFYRVGVPDEERALPQRLLITVEMELDFREAAKTDDLAKTIDYSAVSQRLLQLGEGRSWKLIEKLASDIARLIIKEFHAENAVVEIQKFIIPQTRFVSVVVRRAQTDF